MRLHVATFIKRHATCTVPHSAHAPYEYYKEEGSAVPVSAATDDVWVLIGQLFRLS